MLELKNDRNKSILVPKHAFDLQDDQLTVTQVWDHVSDHVSEPSYEEVRERTPRQHKVSLKVIHPPVQHLPPLGTADGGGPAPSDRFRRLLGLFLFRKRFKSLFSGLVFERTSPPIGSTADQSQPDSLPFKLVARALSSPQLVPHVRHVFAVLERRLLLFFVFVSKEL